MNEITITLTDGRVSVEGAGIKSKKIEAQKLLKLGLDAILDATEEYTNELSMVNWKVGDIGYLEVAEGSADPYVKVKVIKTNHYSLNVEEIETGNCHYTIDEKRLFIESDMNP